MSQATPEVRPALDPFKPLISYSDLEEPLGLVRGDALALEILIQALSDEPRPLDTAIQHLIYLMADHVRMLTETISGLRQH